MDLNSAIRRIASDFAYLRDRVPGVLLFGSAAVGRPYRDLDVCIVAGDADPGEILFEAFRNVDVRGRGYDVWIFEELPIFMRRAVLRNHRVVLARDEPALYERLRPHYRLAEDMERRLRAAR